jgi:hypothetical protein
MGILGIYASQISGHLSAPFDSLQTVTVGSGGASSISFTGIPSIYKHLQLRIVARATDANAANYANLKVNSDTTLSNYARHLLVGNGSSAASYNSTGSTITNLGEIPAATATSGMFGVFVVDILDYQNTNKYKTIRSLGGDDRNGGGEVNYNSILWMSTTAISSIQLTTYTSANFAENTQAALYGIKGE